MLSFKLTANGFGLNNRFNVVLARVRCLVLKIKAMEKHIEQIECPECGKRQIATVLHTFPWWSYVHDCVSCKYTIMESEWVLINTEDELKQIELANEVDDDY